MPTKRKPEDPKKVVVKNPNMKRTQSITTRVKNSQSKAKNKNV
jgi:hypothetical protein